MTPYLIFAAVLTVAYIIYYGYNISKDIYGKKGREENSEEELEIDVPDGGIAATPVREVEGGFTVGNAADADQPMQPVVVGTPQQQPMPLQQQIPSQQPVPPIQPVQQGVQPTAEPKKSAVSVRFIESINSRLAEADIQSEGGVTGDEFYAMLLAKNSTIGFRKSKIKVQREQF